MLQVKSFKGGYDNNFSYLVWDDVSLAGCIIDTALDPSLILQFAKDNNINVRSAVVMHSHFDHTVKLDEYGDIELVGHKNLPQNVARRVNDGDHISVGSYKLEVMYCPGHTKDAICLLGDGKLFTTDVLFIDGCGRCDLAGGDVEEMFASLQKLKGLGDDVVVYPGHDYGSKEFDTIGNQKRNNRFLVSDKDEFIGRRE